MGNNKFDLLEDIDLTSEEREYFDEQNDVSEIIIKLIKRRIDLKMTQRELAEKTGIKQPMIARIETFDSIPRLDTLVKIARELNLKIDFDKTVKICFNVNVDIRINYQTEEKSVFYTDCFNDMQINLPTIS